MTGCRTTDRVLFTIVLLFSTINVVYKDVLILGLASWLTVVTCVENINDTDPLQHHNSTDPNKDMYVIHAMVYQVGIVTNKTENDTYNYNTTGNQEAITFYHHNGSQVDLSKIGSPLLTNVTAQSLVGVAPLAGHPSSMNNTMPWSALSHLANMPSPPLPLGPHEEKKSRRTIRDNSNLDILAEAEASLDNFYRNLFKREVPGAIPVAIHSGAAVIPESAGVHSIAIPPLLTLNNNMSGIPVPIPNTSLVHYAKINTLVSKT